MQRSLVHGIDTPLYLRNICEVYRAMGRLDEALDTARRLAGEEGLLCGPSSGMNVTAAHKIAAAHPEFRRIVTVIPDTGQRYLSGELDGTKPPADEPDRDHALDPDTLARLAEHQNRLEFI